MDTTSIVPGEITKDTDLNNKRYNETIMLNRFISSAALCRLPR